MFLSFLIGSDVRGLVIGITHALGALFFKFLITTE